MTLKTTVGSVAELVKAFLVHDRFPGLGLSAPGGNRVQFQAVPCSLGGDASPYSPRAFAAVASTRGTRNGFVRYPDTPRFTASMALASVE